MPQGQSVTVGSPCPVRGASLARSSSAAQDRLIIEDGWVFREHHGKYVECICRSDELTLLGHNSLRAVGH